MYSISQRFINAAIAALVLFDSPIVEGNRNYVGSLRFTLPLEDTGKQVIRGIRLLDWQLEDLVSRLALNSDNQLLRILSPDRFGYSEVELVLHTRKVGDTYVNPRTKKEFTVKEDPESSAKIGDLVYSIELSDTAPLSLSELAQEYLRKLSFEADVEEQRSMIKKASSDYELRRAKRLEEQARRNAMQNPEPKTEPEPDPVLSLELEKLLAVATPTVKQKNRIAELQELLGAE